ncbi:hypothetical protein FN846DRAFT_909576 [Sphaerosporella brunnea]|uniref:Actin-like ATPase domain-containing protein n=1 Tax=Sphaerosporella brunnea TaxID=1250544 RepID=A0A5J5EQP6_9PEZI|nr:hypothetical protein FN846DRAFT_909576 [Sphaerosporella brunnea]
MFEAPPGKTLANVVHDFWQGVYQHLIQVLTSEGWSPQMVNYQFLFTVPAPFSSLAIEAFKRIISGTGFARHGFQVEITEPEAAALYTLRNQPSLRTRPAGFQTRQSFVVCDAGGGTVYLSSYSITQSTPTIRMEQTGIVTGYRCGSTFIDQNLLLDNFIQQKEWFNKESYQETINIELPRNGDLYCPVKRGNYLPITRQQMLAFFSEPIAKTCQLVVDHVKECKSRNYQINYVFLVGGFGSSLYLGECLQRSLRNIDPNILVIKPPDAQQSVVLGCLFTQLQRLRRDDDPVKVRLCRAHFGVVCSMPFNPTKHSEHEKYIEPVTGQVLARGQIMWLIHKGDRISDTTSADIERTLIRSFKTTPTMAWTETLVCSTAYRAPLLLGPSVQEVCKMTSDLRSCGQNEFQK